MLALDLFDLNRATLARQLLLERSSLGVQPAIEHLLGLQAQAPWPPYYALASRLENFDPTELGALLTSKNVVRSVLMRSTVHLSTASDLWHLFAFTNRHVSSKLDPQRLTELLEQARSFIDEKHPTQGEVLAHLSCSFPELDSTLLYRTLRSHLPMVQLPPRAVWGSTGPARLATAASWVPKIEPQSDEKIIERFLRAYGPASVQDIQTWSGRTKLASTLEHVPGVIKLRGSISEVLYDLEDAPRPPGSTPAPPRLLAPFDSLLLAHKDRYRVSNSRTLHRFFSSPNGVIPGAVLVDGFLTGTWDISNTSSTTRVRISPYKRISKTVKTALEQEALLLPALHPIEVRIERPV